MRPPVLVRPIQQEDYDQWKPLWDGYNEFYGRSGLLYDKVATHSGFIVYGINL